VTHMAVCHIHMVCVYASICDMSLYASICNKYVGRVSRHVRDTLSFAKEPYNRDYILQKRPIIFRSLLIIATRYQIRYAVYMTCFFLACDMTDSYV